jgi:hypothetical protein
MKKHRGKWLVLLAVIAGGLGAAVCVLWFHPGGSAHRIDLDTAEKVCAGMTQRQVEGLFGVPPGDYSSQPGTMHCEGVAERWPGLRREDWTADEGGAVVYFDADGRVADRIVWVAPSKQGASQGASKFAPLRKLWHGLTLR